MKTGYVMGSGAMSIFTNGKTTTRGYVAEMGHSRRNAKGPAARHAVATDESRIVQAGPSLSGLPRRCVPE